MTINHSSSRQLPVTNSNITNVAEKTIQSGKAFNNYLQQQQKSQQQQQIPNIEELLKSCDQMLSLEKAAESEVVVASPPPALLLKENIKKSKNKANTKNKLLVQKQQQYVRTLSSVNLLRTLQKAEENTENGVSNFIMVPLAEQNKFREQWVRQPSDTLTLEQRERLKILLTKSTKTRMKQQARAFCRTNQPIEDIQRGSLCYIYHDLLKVFNPMSQQLFSLGPMKCTSTMVVLSNVIPAELLKKVFDHLFAVQAENRKNASPNSKKKVPSIDELMQTKESGRVFHLINEWLWQHLPTRDMANKIQATGGELPLQTYVNRLKSCRAEIVLIMKALEENQCQNEAVDSFQKMVLHVQTLNESINTQLQTQSARVKMSENIAQINKMNLNLLNNSRTALVARTKQQQHQYLKRKSSGGAAVGAGQQQQQQVGGKKTKLIAALPNKKSSQKDNTGAATTTTTAPFKFTIPKISTPVKLLASPPPPPLPMLPSNPQLPKQQSRRRMVTTTSTTKKTTMGGKNVIAFKEQVELQQQQQ